MAACLMFDSKKFAVVEFEGQSVSLVSASWLCGTDQCYWPHAGNERMMAKSHAPVNSDWSLWPCRILGTSGLCLFTTRCYAERGYATVCRPSVHPSVRPSVCDVRTDTTQN